MEQKIFDFLPIANAGKSEKAMKMSTIFILYSEVKEKLNNQRNKEVYWINLTSDVLLQQYG